MRMAAVSILPGAKRLRQYFALGPSTRNHGLITGWRIFGVLSNRMETIVDPSGLGLLVSTVSRKRSNQLSYGPTCGWLRFQFYRSPGDYGNVSRRAQVRGITG